MAKKQRQYKEGTEYTVTGPSEREGRFKMKGTVRMGRKEMLLFQRVRKVRKRRPRRHRKAA